MKVEGGLCSPFLVSLTALIMDMRLSHIRVPCRPETMAVDERGKVRSSTRGAAGICGGPSMARLSDQGSRISPRVSNGCEDNCGGTDRLPAARQRETQGLSKARHKDKKLN